MHVANPVVRLWVAWMAVLLLVACGAPTPSAQPSSSPSVASPSAPGVTAAPSLAPSFGPLTSVSLQQIASGFNDPVGVTNAGDGSGRLFVNERGGRIRVVNPDGSVQATDFVDLSAEVEAGGERGLLGVAFHPQFATNGRLFVHYSRKGDGATVISELTASTDRSSAIAASERVIFTLSQPFANHNGGEIAFGRDGYFYVGLGDGGSGGDPFGNGQNRQVLLGKILRIDLDAPHAVGKEYAIPDTNPYAPGGIEPGAGLPEIWAYGLRNPWRFSFDRGTDDLYIGDVGQNAWEEIDRQPAGSRGGENYGWVLFEGSHCSADCSSITAVLPISEYGHVPGGGCSVTGGYVYRGARQPAMAGKYLFSDFCSGTIWTPSPTGALAAVTLAESGLQVASFGEGEDGEIYLVDLMGGGLYRVVAGG